MEGNSLSLKQRARTKTQGRSEAWKLIERMAPDDDPHVTRKTDGKVWQQHDTVDTVPATNCRLPLNGPPRSEGRKQRKRRGRRRGEQKSITTTRRLTTHWLLTRLAAPDSPTLGREHPFSHSDPFSPTAPTRSAMPKPILLPRDPPPLCHPPPHTYTHPLLFTLVFTDRDRVIHFAKHRTPPYDTLVPINTLLSVYYLANYYVVS